MERYHSYSKPRKKLKSEIENRNGSERLQALCHALFHVYVLTTPLLRWLLLLCPLQIKEL